MRRLLARDVMSSPVVSVSEEASVRELARTLRRTRVSGLPVTGADGRLVGIVTEGDLVRIEAGPGGLPLLAYLARPPSDASWARTDLKRLHARRVRDLMTRDVVTATEDTPVYQVAATMIRCNIKRVPIVREGIPVGIVSRADVVAVFDRPAADVVEDARRVIRDDLLLDPGRFDINFEDGVLRVKGEAEAKDLRLIESFLSQIDGVVEVDTSDLHAASRMDLS